MTLPKFIITMDGYFRLGMVNQHKDLLKPGDSCLGGGYYHFDYTSNRIILDRSSYDFGKPKWHLLEVLKVPSVYRGLRLVYFYDDDREFDVSDGSLDKTGNLSLRFPVSPLSRHIVIYGTAYLRPPK